MFHGSAVALKRYWRNIGSASWLAIDSIWAHKLRTSLTLLGVVVGVASVVMVGAAIQGLGTYATDSTSKVFGTNTFLIAQVANAVSRSEYFTKLIAQPILLDTATDRAGKRRNVTQPKSPRSSRTATRRLLAAVFCHNATILSRDSVVHYKPY
jgi:ABC-type antimicrobial peptide transport system permease subunit